LSDAENTADDEHEEADCGKQGGGQEQDDARLCPHSGTAHLPVEFLVDAIPIIIFFVHDDC
jgi:hypothetical protein